MQVQKTRQRFAARTGTALLTVAVALSVLAGCATGGRTKPEPVVEAPPMAAGPLVTRLDDGREGFVITEMPTMDAASRRDFEGAVTLLNERDFEGAIGLLEQVIERSPGVTAPYIDIALAYVQVDEPDQAEKYLKTALDLVADHPVASNEYGLLLRKSGRFAEARQVYEKTLVKFPEYLPVRRNLGILCDLYLDDPACALEQYQTYSEAMPDDEEVKLWIADLRMRLGGGG